MVIKSDRALCLKFVNVHSAQAKVLFKILAPFFKKKKLSIKKKDRTNGKKKIFRPDFLFNSNLKLNYIKLF
jgi:hypothetical protein